MEEVRDIALTFMVVCLVLSKMRLLRGGEITLVTWVPNPELPDELHIKYINWFININLDIMKGMVQSYIENQSTLLVCLQSLNVEHFSFLIRILLPIFFFLFDK